MSVRALRAGFLLLASLAFAPCQAQAIEVGKPAPALQAQLLDGGDFRLEQHRGEVVVIDFWACWCAPCIEELNALQTLHEKYRERGLTVLAINTDDAEDLKKVQKIVQPLGFANALAAQVKAPGYGRIWRLPITFIIDRQGVLREDGGAGPRHRYDLPTLEKMIEPWLAAPR